MNRMMALLAGSVVSIVCVEAVMAQESAELPIRKITLYHSGVGAFERQGLIAGSKKVELKFETDQINDILKSMVLLDLDGGRIDGVSYASKEPLERRLASFGVDISQAGSMDKLFNQLRGARLRVTTSEGTYEGPILGVESRKTVIPPTPGGNPGHYDEWYVNIVAADGVRSIPTSAIRTFALVDQELNEELNKALAALAEYRGDRVKSVEMSFSGPEVGDRRVAVSYVHEMPVWKTSYRLVLPESEENKPTVQGWAVVENVTDQDWKDVRLALASGRPVGFQMDLYQPLFASRMWVPVPMMTGIGPRVYETATNVVTAQRDMESGFQTRSQKAGRAMAGAPAPAAEMAPADGSRGDPRSLSYDSYMAVDAGDMTAYAAAAQASAGDVGEQFMYTLDAPVTLERQKSAMLPILSSNIEGRRVSIFNVDQLREHPMRGVELTNDTNLHLMPGPIAVYDGAAYAGDAQIPHTSRDQKRLLSYAVDLDVGATTETGAGQDLLRVKIVNGMIEQTWKQHQGWKYQFDNRDSKRPRTLLVEHSKMHGWELISKEKPSETTEQRYRFEMTLKPSSSGVLDVVMERTSASVYEMANFDLPTLIGYAQNGKASQAVVDAVKKAAAMQAGIAATQRKIDELAQERASIEGDQNRLRGNMGTIDRNSELYARYMKKLGEQESRVEWIVDETRKSTASREDQVRALEEFVRDLDVE